MKEFILIFRNSESNSENPSPEQMQAIMKQWQDWIGGIAAQNKLVSSGNRLASEGSKVVKPNNIITNGPFVEIKEAVGGYIIVKAMSVDEAVELSKSCPILQIGGSVEVRTIVAMENM